MSIATLILGESGSGKTTSLRNLDPGQTLLIQAIPKPLPFRSAVWKRIAAGQPGSIFVADKADQILNAMHRTAKPVIVIDDFQYVLAAELLRRTAEKGYEKFSDIALHTWQILEGAGALREHQRVYILAHNTTDEGGRVRMKTVGRMVDEKIVPEGWVTILLRTIVEGGQYGFRTQTDGNDPCKSPMGLFADQVIDNDLAAVDAAIVDYYGITMPEPKEPQAA